MWICGVWEPPLPCRSNNTENKRITPTVTSPRLERPAGRPKKHAGVLDRPALAWDLGMSCVCVCVFSLLMARHVRGVVFKNQRSPVAGSPADRMPFPCSCELYRMSEQPLRARSVRAGKRQLASGELATDGAERPSGVGVPCTGPRDTAHWLTCTASLWAGPCRVRCALLLR